MIRVSENVIDAHARGFQGVIPRNTLAVVEEGPEIVSQNHV